VKVGERECFPVENGLALNGNRENSEDMKEDIHAKETKNQKSS
jgi:hypothetical protein